MNCTHEQLRCTDGVFYCLKCGAIVPNPYKPGINKAKEEAPVEAQKKPVKRKAKTV